MQKWKIVGGVVLAHLVACYHPDLRDCTVTCESADDCTGGQQCQGGWCAMPGKDCSKHDPEFAPDAAAATADVPNLCAQGCTNGTCVDGVCVIDCTNAWSCQGDVFCPANLPCRVDCGYHACGHHVVCGLASSCEVNCAGDYSCNDEIQCNTKSCDVTCSGSSSCRVRTKCDNACACDVACTGLGSCGSPSVCPASTCILGKGCTSLVAGCNSCP